MKRIILYSVCIGTLALAVTAWGEQAKDRRPARANASRAANVHAARPANTGAAMGGRHYNSTAQFRQRSYATPRAHSNAVNRKPVAATPSSRSRRIAGGGAAATPATVRERNLAVNRTRNFNVNRDRNVAMNRSVRPASARPATVAPSATVRNRNVAVNGTRNNFAYYRGGNARINNNFHSAAFRGHQYAAFRNYHRQWHDRGWWRRHCDRIVFVIGGWYYWNAGYWFPAWGYDPYAYYAFDGPIYGYNGLSPDQVVVDVQQQLQRDGYYDGPIDGVLGPMTREAIAAFQADNGLAVTSVVDEPTLSALGVA